MNFADHYRRLVIPQLQTLIDIEATFCAHGCISFMDAWSAVMSRAQRLGASLLPEDVFTDLEDWVSSTLLNEIQAAERLSGYP